MTMTGSDSDLQRPVPSQYQDRCVLYHWEKLQHSFRPLSWIWVAGKGRMELGKRGVEQRIDREVENPGYTPPITVTWCCTEVWMPPYRCWPFWCWDFSALGHFGTARYGAGCFVAGVATLHSDTNNTLGTKRNQHLSFCRCCLVRDAILTTDWLNWNMPILYCLFLCICAKALSHVQWSTVFNGY